MFRLVFLQSPPRSCSDSVSSTLAHLPPLGFSAHSLVQSSLPTNSKQKKKSSLTIVFPKLFSSLSGTSFHTTSPTLRTPTGLQTGRLSFIHYTKPSNLVWFRQKRVFCLRFSFLFSNSFLNHSLPSHVTLVVRRVLPLFSSLLTQATVSSCLSFLLHLFYPHHERNNFFF